MKPITFTAAGMLAGLANMLELLGYDTGDRDIALGMEAPYLLVFDQGCYKAGSGLYRPQWLNLYLHPRGFNMTEKVIPKGEVAAFLRANKPVMLPLTISKGVIHPVVFAAYENERYEFINIKPSYSTEPTTLSLTATTLKRRLADDVTVYTLTSCEPATVDFLPLLLTSLDILDAYQEELLAARQRIMNRAEFTALHTTLFRPLMQDLQPMMTLIGDADLAEELRRLNHDYRHVFTNDAKTAALYERLPKTSIRNCIAWVRENILDRLYALSNDEEALEAQLQARQKKSKLQ